MHRLHAHQAGLLAPDPRTRSGPASRPTPSTATRASWTASRRSTPSRAARSHALIATDVAARGLDIDELPYVINYELPNVAGGLRAPHRPHRPRRQDGQRHLAGQRRRRRLSGRHREADQAARSSRSRSPVSSRNRNTNTPRGTSANAARRRAKAPRSPVAEAVHDRPERAPAPAATR